LDRWSVDWSGYGFESPFFGGLIKGGAALAALAVVSANGGKGTRRREEDAVEVDLLRGAVERWERWREGGAIYFQR
jgi:hypothetical protein